MCEWIQKWENLKLSNFVLKCQIWYTEGIHGPHKRLIYSDLYVGQFVWDLNFASYSMFMDPVKNGQMTWNHLTLGKNWVPCLVAKLIPTENTVLFTSKFYSHLNLGKEPIEIFINQIKDFTAKSEWVHLHWIWLNLGEFFITQIQCKKFLFVGDWWTRLYFLTAW